MQELCIFDFDGTLTRKDTFIEFSKYVVGKKKTIITLLLFSPLLIGMKLHIINNGWLKQSIFSFLYNGMPYKVFKEKGQLFAKEISTFENEQIIKILKEKQTSRITIIVISASVYEWVAPWCKKNNIDNIICTNIEVKNDMLTGRFSTPNCYGQEKVVRLINTIGDLKKYHITVYGDSNGDRELFKIADHSINI